MSAVSFLERVTREPITTPSGRSVSYLQKGSHLPLDTSGPCQGTVNARAAILIG